MLSTVGSIGAASATNLHGTSNSTVANNGNGFESNYATGTTSVQDDSLLEEAMKKRNFSLKDHAEQGDEAHTDLNKVLRYKFITVAPMGLYRQISFIRSGFSQQWVR